jgi:Polysaccharide deacetylase
MTSTSSPSAPRNPGALVISLDFELHWGLRDHVRLGDPYERNLRGERVAIDRMLELFGERGIGCTWATVGMLFARDRAELDRFSPSRRPRYDDTRLDPYGEHTGDDFRDDPLHFAPDVIERVRAVPRQEIASHTFSHYYCLEAGQTETDFRSDLDAAVGIAAAHGVKLRSIVFPRNQVNRRYAAALRDVGIRSYRGTQLAWMYAARTRDPAAKRAARLLDAYVPFAGDHLVGWDEIRDKDGLACVRASLFLRAWSRRLRALEGLRVRRLREAVRRAARERKVLHVWWHPHNFGVNTEENIGVLRHILDEYEACRVQYGMESLTMGEAADRVL